MIHERIKQWFGLLGGALAWLIHLLVTSVAGESGCVLEGTLFVFLKISAVGWLLIAVSAATLATAGLSVRIAWRYRKSAQEAVRFMGQAGLVSNLIFLGIILTQTLPIAILLRGC